MATASVTRRTRIATAKKSAAVAGRFGVYGGRYVPETLMAALEELDREYEKAKRDRKFQQRLEELLRTYAGRPTPLFFARRLTQKLGGAKIYLKREDLLHTGAHKINNCLGQALLVEAMRDWVTNVRTTHYLLGSVLGAHPYPTMVRDFHRVIGKEARAQILKAEGKLPAEIIACVGGGSNSIGIFYDFIKDKKVRLVGVEAGGRGEALGDHAARFRGGRPGVLQGTYSYV